MLWLDSKYFSESYWWDRSRYRNDGVVHGTMFKHDAFYFNGSDNYVDCGSNEVLNISNAVTIEAWIKPEKFDYGIIVSKGIVLTDGYWFQMGSQNGLIVHFYLDTGDLRVPNSGDGGTLTLNEWHYVIATFDGNIGKIYIDGSEIASNNKSGSVISNNRNLLIGEYNGGGHNFKGSMGFVRIYNKTLSEEEIKTLYNLTYRR